MTAHVGCRLTLTTCTQPVATCRRSLMPHIYGAVQGCVQRQHKHTGLCRAVWNPMAPGFIIEGDARAMACSARAHTNRPDASMVLKNSSCRTRPLPSVSASPIMSAASCRVSSSPSCHRQAMQTRKKKNYDGIKHIGVLGGQIYAGWSKKFQPFHQHRTVEMSVCSAK